LFRQPRTSAAQNGGILCSKVGYSASLNVVQDCLIEHNNRCLWCFPTLKRSDAWSIKHAEALVARLTL